MMHSMSQSAAGLRERKMAQTSHRLTALARSWTAGRGSTGFTVEELCEAVGVSRRTFFNYFASKEDAILGFPIRRDIDELDEAFAAGGAGERMPSGLSKSLLDDLTELAVARWELDGVTAEEATQLFAAIDHEPRLLARMLERSRSQEAGDIALVERREDLRAGDLRAATAVQLIGAVFRASVEEFLGHRNSDPFHDVLARRLAAARSVFSL